MHSTSPKCGSRHFALVNYTATAIAAAATYSTTNTAATAAAAITTTTTTTTATLQFLAKTVAMTALWFVSRLTMTVIYCVGFCWSHPFAVDNCYKSASAFCTSGKGWGWFKTHPSVLFIAVLWLFFIAPKCMISEYNIYSVAGNSKRT